jgi:16S rRNA processing protein RimM
MTQYISVGKLRKPHGISGAFAFILDREPKALVKVIPHFFMEIKGDYLPYFVSGMDWLDTETGYVQFEEINTPELAKRYSGTALYMEEGMVSKYFKKERQDPADLLGYMLVDGEIEVATIVDITETLAHPIAVLDRGGELLIPLVEDWLVDIDHRHKRIIMNLPEGLY